MAPRRLKIVFMGTPDFAVSSLDAICEAGYDVVGVVTVPDRQTGRGLKVTYSPVKNYALEHNIPLLQPERLKNPDFLKELESLQADMFVVVAFRMLPKEVWAMPPMGTFNLHASLLPQYRGAAPINWAIINGEKQSGATTFLLNEKIDEGKILLQETTPISISDTAETLHDRLAEMGRKLVVRTIEGLADGSIEPQSQVYEGELKPAPKIFKPDCAIHWDWNGERILNHVRGLSPYPAATMLFEDNHAKEQAFKVFEVGCEICPDSIPGEVKTDGKKYLKIGCGDGFIDILNLQMNGKKRITVEEFLRGYDVSAWKIVM